MRIVIWGFTIGIGAMILGANLGNALSMGATNYYQFITVGPQVGETYSKKEKNPFEKVEQIKIVDAKNGYVQYQRVGEKSFLDMGITNYSMQNESLYILYTKDLRH